MIIIYILLCIIVILLYFLFKKTSVIRSDFVDMHNKMVDIGHKLEKVFSDDQDDNY